MGSVERERRIAELENHVGNLAAVVFVLGCVVGTIVVALLLAACTDGSPVGPDWKPCEKVVYFTPPTP